MASSGNDTSASQTREGVFYNGVGVGITAALANPLSGDRTINYVYEDKTDVSLSSLAGSSSVPYPVADDKSSVTGVPVAPGQTGKTVLFIR